MNTYKVNVYKLHIVRDSDVTVITPQHNLSTPAAAADIIRSYLAGSDREHFVVVMMSTKNQVIGLNTVSVGHLSGALVHPREVFKAAIIANAHSIIIAHNHPSGDPHPSQEDANITDIIQKAGELLQIRLLDHIIIGENDYYSFKNDGKLA
jgi:DNA repair protein RadC